MNNFFFLVVLIFLFMWWFKNSLQRNKSVKKERAPVLTTQPYSSESTDQLELSDLQKWILEQSQTQKPEQLDEALSAAFQKNDWNLLKPSDYSRWSRYYWGI